MLDQSVKTLQNTDKMCYDFRVCKRLAPSMKTLTKILTKCVMISESLLSRPQVWKHWPKYWHYASWFLSLYELQRSPKVYIAQKVYIVFKLQLFLHPNINYYFFIFSKYSPFSTMPHLFSPLPLFLDFFNLVKKSCF